MLAIVFTLFIFSLVISHSVLLSITIESAICYHEDGLQSHTFSSADTLESQEERDGSHCRETEYQTNTAFETANYLGDINGYCGGGGVIPPYPEYPQFPAYAPYPAYPPDPMYPEYAPNPPYPVYPEFPIYPPNPPYAPFPSYASYPAYPDSPGASQGSTFTFGNGNEPLPTSPNADRPNVINVNFVQDVLNALQSFQATTPVPVQSPLGQPNPSPIVRAKQSIQQRGKNRNNSKLKPKNKRPFFRYVGRIFRVF